MRVCRERFLRYLQPGQRILDAGCGSGRDTIAFRKAGYETDAFDASAEICRLASERTGIRVRQCRFEELEGEAQYDGIWACACLIHVARDDFGTVLGRLAEATRTGGPLHASVREGDGEDVSTRQCISAEALRRDILARGCLAVRTYRSRLDRQRGPSVRRKPRDPWLSVRASRA
jgi:2-polyprenyl-3-methyl-5-hydroxy-6-metoxy-1,4-benzoquinol methylase